MVALDLGAVVDDSVAQPLDVVGIELLAFLVVDDLLQRHVRLVLNREPVLINVDRHVELLGILLPAVNEQVTEAPAD